MTEEQVFLAALDLLDRANRTAYLAEVCGENIQLRHQVEELLAAHERSGQFLDEPAAEQMAAGPQSPAGQTLADMKKIDDDADDLSFLTPSTRPDSLGRLGHYEMLQVLGRGGFGIVFRAFDDILQRVVAVKVMAPQIACLSPARKRFLREARSSAQVRHENVVQVYEVGEQPLPYLTMEFIPGETLQQKLDRSGPLDVSEILRIGRQIAEGLAAAHACDLIHRDIKPGNILLEGGSHKAKITDFGLARAADDASISQSGIIAGTPMFMAPEQALGRHIDQRADLFSLGSVMYQMASGRPPFRAPSALAVLKRVAEEPPRPIPEIIPETPDWLCGIITKLHAKNPDDRFQSAREVADLLADCEAKLKAKQEVKNVLPAAVKPAAPTASRGRKWVAAAAVLLLPVIALAVTEFAGVTHLFRGPQATSIESKPGSEPTDPLVAKQEPPSPDTIVAKPTSKGPGAKADDWVQLFNGKDLTGWNLRSGIDPSENSWKVVGGVNWKENGIPEIEAGTGVLLNNGGAQGADLVSDSLHGDCELRIEFLVLKQADSGIYFQGQYELQIQDRPEDLFGNRPSHWHTGAIYNSQKPPRVNVSKPPGEWQSFDVIFQAPRFGLDGKKTADAKFIKVSHNGIVVQENVKVFQESPYQLNIPESSQGPLMLQSFVGQRISNLCQR